MLQRGTGLVALFPSPFRIVTLLSTFPAGKLPLLASLELPHQSYVQEVSDKKSSEFKLFEAAAQHLVREEAEPLAFPPLESYEPDDQALWKLYDSELSTPSSTETVTA